MLLKLFNKNYKFIFFVLLLLFLSTRLYILFSPAFSHSDLLSYFYYCIGYFSDIYQVNTSKYPYFLEYYQLIKNSYPEPCLLLIREIFNFSYRLNNELSYSLFIFIFRGFGFVLDLLMYLTIFIFCQKYLNKHHKRYAIDASLIYTVLGFILFPVLYDRLDIFLLFMVFIAFLFFIFSRFLLALLFLTMSILFKLVPLLLSPLFILPKYRFLSSKLKQPGKRFMPVFSSHWFYSIVLFSSLITVFCATFYYFLGPSFFDFLQFHKSRGLHVESVMSGFLLLCRYFEYPVQLVRGPGSIDIGFSKAQEFVQLSGLLTITTIIALHAYLFRFYSFAYFYIENTKQAALRAVCIAASIVVLFTGAFVFSKVLSTQYFVWLIPFLALTLPLFNWYHYVLWLLIFAFTSFIFPVYFFSDIVPSIMGPSGWGMTLLLCRNSCLILVLILILRDFYCILKPFKSDP